MKKVYKITPAGGREKRTDADIEARIFRDEPISTETLDSHNTVIESSAF